MTTYPQMGPLLNPGDELPGGWGIGADGQQTSWVGEWHWRTQHGKAVVQWRIGKIAYVHDALMADGSRQGVQACSDTVEGATMPGGILETYRTPKDAGFIHGKIDVSADEVAFAATEQPTLTVEPSDQPLFDAIRGDVALMRDLQREVMAFALHEAIMRSKEWTLIYNGIETAFVPRYAAHFVAALRANGEFYGDYFGRAFDDLREEHIEVMRDHLTRLGISQGGGE